MKFLLFILLVTRTTFAVQVGTLNIWPVPPPAPPVLPTNMIIFIGQSNARGNVGVLSTTQPYQNLMWDVGELGTGESATNQTLTSFIPLVEGNTKESPASACAKQLSYLTGSNYIVVNYARNGALYDTIKKGGSGSNYSLSLGNVTAARTLNPTMNVLGLVSFHGEADGDEQYMTKAVQWQSNYEADIEIITGQSGRVPIFHSQCQQSPSAHYDGVVNAMEADAAKNPCLGPRYMTVAAGDGSHYTNWAYQIFGELAAKAIYRHCVQGNVETALRPIKIATYTNCIFISYTGMVGNLVFDTVNVTDPNGHHGFDYTDLGTSPPTISSEAIIDAVAGIVQLTLTGNPTASGYKRVGYASVGGAGGATSGARGCLRDSDTMVGQSSGTNLWNWSTAFIKELNWP